jgi:hypothetical protein
MNISKGRNENQENCLQLKKTIYDLGQSEREFYKKLTLVLKHTVFVKSKSDPCLLSNWNGKEVIIIGIYIDDCLVVGKEERIQWLIVDLKNTGFNLKVENNRNDYLSCHIIEDKESNQIMILQPNLINDLRDKFGNEVLEKRTYRTSWNTNVQGNPS